MIHEAWKPTFKIWFPEGADDPNIVLLHVKGEDAEYWDSAGVTALVTGPAQEIKEGSSTAMWNWRNESIFARTHRPFGLGWTVNATN